VVEEKLKVPPDRDKSELRDISSAAPVPAVERPRSFPVSIVKTCSAFQSDGRTMLVSTSSGMADWKECFKETVITQSL
jgi:hypothetical protein